MTLRSILWLLPCLALSTATPATRADDVAGRLTIQRPRTSGPVSVSLQNEINAAIDRSRDWLLVQQNADGSWGTNTAPRTRVTALAALALLNDNTDSQRAAALRGCRWLATNTPPELPDAPSVNAAWRALALRVASSVDTSLTAVATAALASATNHLLSPMHAMLLRELEITNTPGVLTLPPIDLAGACIGVMPSPAAHKATPNILVHLASQWPAIQSGFRNSATLGRTQRSWIFAHFVNSAGGGTLADAQGRVLDWRNELAQVLVESQSIAPNNKGGYWTNDKSPSLSSQIEETAFALLALDEL